MEGINHYGAVGLRVVGSGNLKTTFYSLDDVESSALVDYTMATTSAREPIILSNFKQQRAALDVRVSSMGEYFTISAMAIFTKPIATGFPQ